MIAFLADHRANKRSGAHRIRKLLETLGKFETE